ncbi:MAG: YkgJ family cysteine cluster protein [Candidatus Woesearchaeota archaeon]
MDEFTPNEELLEKNKNSKKFICTQCGECCHIREKKNVSLEEEKKYFNYMYYSFGIIYLSKLQDITINIWPEEKDLLEKEAKNLGIKIKILPKRCFYNSEQGELVIIDYYIDHDICPFFKKNLCIIYDKRPLICKSYPLLTENNLGKCIYKKNTPDAHVDEMPFAKRNDYRIKTIKNKLIELKEKKIIDTNIPIEKILQKKLKIKELRINTI